MPISFRPETLSPFPMRLLKHKSLGYLRLEELPRESRFRYSLNTYFSVSSLSLPPRGFLVLSFKYYCAFKRIFAMIY